MPWNDCNNTDAGDLTIGGVAMNCAAWRVENLWELWLPGQQRGEDPVRPGVTGRKPNRRWVDATTRSLHLRITGWADRLGNPFTNPYLGLQTNIDYLIANVITPTGTATGTRSAVLTMPSGSTRTEPIHVVGMEAERVRGNGTEALMVIEVSIPTGQIT